MLNSRRILRNIDWDQVKSNYSVRTVLFHKLFSVLSVKFDDWFILKIRPNAGLAITKVCGRIHERVAPNSHSKSKTGIV